MSSIVKMRPFNCCSCKTLFFKKTKRGDTALILSNHPLAESSDKVLQ